MPEMQSRISFGKYAPVIKSKRRSCSWLIIAHMPEGELFWIIEEITIKAASNPKTVYE